MTKERIQAIADALSKDDAERKALLGMEPAAAAEELKKQGYDFTADELIEFGKLVAEATASGELGDDQLENVSGGSITIGVLLGVTFGTKVAYDIGKELGKRFW